VGWQEALGSGRTLWAELVHRYSEGVDEVGLMREAWATVEARVDAQRFGEVSDFLQIQHYEARWWRDACLSYFAQVNQLSIPAGYAAPANSLSFYQGLTCPSDATKPRCNQVYTGSPSPAVLP
jgi:alpha-glucuronidase